LMQPATAKAWHTRAFKLYWRWKSRKKPGRPPGATAAGVHRGVLPCRPAPSGP
jgi:hypothetical protein